MAILCYKTKFSSFQDVFGKSMEMNKTFWYAISGWKQFIFLLWNGWAGLKWRNRWESMVLQYKSISSLLATIVTEDFDFSYANFKLGRKLLISQVYLHFLSRSLFELRKPFSILSITHIWWSKLSSNGCSRNLSNDFSFKFKEVVFQYKFSHFN